LSGTFVFKEYGLFRPQYGEGYTNHDEEKALSHYVLAYRKPASIALHVTTHAFHLDRVERELCDGCLGTGGWLDPSPAVISFTQG
jgi:hypothetical protein